MVLHVRLKSWYISTPSSEKQLHEITKFYVFWRTRTAFSYLPLELNAVSIYLAWVSVQTDRRTEKVYAVATFESKIQIYFLQDVVLAVTSVIAKTLIPSGVR